MRVVVGGGDAVVVVFASVNWSPRVVNLVVFVPSVNWSPWVSPWDAVVVVVASVN